MQILVFVSLCLLAAVSAAPASSPYIVKYYNENDGSGNYRFGFTLSDGTSREEIGELVNRGLENEHISVSGKYEWVGPDNIQYIVNYKADENGYHPSVTTTQQAPEENGSFSIQGLPAAVIGSLLG